MQKIGSSVIWPTLLVAPCQPHYSIQLGLCSQPYALQSAPVTHWFRGYWETGRATKLSGHIQQELHLLSLPRIEPQFLGCPVHSLATRLTELCWLLLYWIISTLLEKICHTMKGNYFWNWWCAQIITERNYRARNYMHTIIFVHRKYWINHVLDVRSKKVN
jgi:hypothetical protein